MSIPVPPGLGDFEALKKRRSVAMERREQWRSILSDAFRYTVPHRDTFLRKKPGQKVNLDIFDSTAVYGLTTYASRSQAMLIPPWRRWSILAPGSEIPEQEREEIQLALDQITEIVFDHINHSNLSTQANEAFLDAGISTGVMTLEDSERDEGSLLEFNSIPVTTIAPEEGPKGTIETVWRDRETTYRMLDRLWPRAEWGDDVRKSMSEKPDGSVTLHEGVVFEPRSGMYWTLVWVDKGDGLALAESEEVSPWIVFREFVSPDEVYGRGRVLFVLPDIKTANKIVEFTLRSGALAVGGVWTGVADGVLNPYTARVKPNTIIPVASNSNQNPSLRPLEFTGRADFTQLQLEDIRGNIRRALLSQPFGAIEEQPVRSATEISLRNNEFMQTDGAALARLQTELVERTLKRAVHILKRAGKIPQFRVDGREVTIKHTSPLARAQDQEDLLALSQYNEIVGALGPQVYALGTKIEDLPEYIGQKLGIPQKLLRNEQERRQAQQLAAQAQAQPPAIEGTAV